MLSRFLPRRTPLRFVILAVGRTRTSLLVDLLNRSDRVVCHSELFHASQIYCRDDRRDPLGVTNSPDCATRDRDPIAFLERCYGYERPPIRAVGFKFLHSHDERVLDYLLADPAIAKIVVKRNHLFSFTSLHLAVKANRWARYRDEERSRDKIRVEMKDFLWYCDEYEKWYADIESRIAGGSSGPAHPRLTVFAEDVREDDPRSAIRGIFRFLGVKPVKHLRSGFRPQNADQLADRIENFDEFMRELRTSPWAHLPLEDVHPDNPRRTAR